MRSVVVVWVMCVVSACGAGQEPEVAAAQQAVYECSSPAQRFACDAPENPGKRFVCHANHHGFVKLEVSVNSSHVPGVAHGNNPPDQAPGASADDLGGAAGLDCDCNPRVCAGTCTGAAAGAACDDGDRCTGDGTCSGDVCQPGAPSCAAGDPAGACSTLSGACDPDTGACGTADLPAGTSCDGARMCNGSGDCVECLTAATCPGADSACAARTCSDTGACGVAYSPAGTACGDQLVCDGAGGCVGVPHVAINEVESSGGVPGDWIELTNSGTAAADVSGWKLLDNDDTHTPYVLPAGSTIAPGGFLVVDEAQLVFGLGGADSARLYDATGALVDAYSWTAHAVTTYGRCPDGTGAFRTTTSSTKGAANDCRVTVAINEVESSGGVPGDWVELKNTGPIAVDMTGWVFRDSDDTHAYVLPAGSTIAPGAYFVLDEAQFVFGLGASDAARLYDATGALVDGYAWTTHAAVTYGRCPDGTGAFASTAASTKGAANSCGGGSSGASPWPGRDAVVTVDPANTFGGNASGLYYDGDSLWVARNAPSALFRMAPSGGGQWVPAASWNLHYPAGTGDPDAEDVTQADGTALYVATERDNTAGAVSRLSVLRFDPPATSGDLSASMEWDLTSDLPAVGANLGLEAITWIPDTFLVAHGFFDEHAGHAYAPAEYPGHGTGLFFVGLEANGTIYAYALDQVLGGFTRIATVASGDPTTKALSFDRDSGYLWSFCGAGCGNQSSILTITAGHLAVARQLAKPTTMPNITNEGIAIGRDAQCSGGMKPFWWTDDAETGGHALREDTIPCGAFLP